MKNEVEKMLQEDNQHKKSMQPKHVTSKKRPRWNYSLGELALKAGRDPEPFKAMLTVSIESNEVTWHTKLFKE